MTRIRMSSALGLGCLMSLGLVGCRSQVSRLPEPSYEHPQLPPFEPPTDPSENVDAGLPSDALLSGEWASEEARPAAAPQENVDLGAHESQNSSTGAADHATVLPPQSD